MHSYYIKKKEEIFFKKTEVNLCLNRIQAVSYQGKSTNPC